MRKHAGTDHHLFKQDKEHRKHMLHTAVQLHVLLQFPFQRSLTAAPQTEQFSVCILHVYAVMTSILILHKIWHQLGTPSRHAHTPKKEFMAMLKRVLCQLHCITRHSLSSLQKVHEDHRRRDNQEYVGLVRPARCWPDLRT